MTPVTTLTTRPRPRILIVEDDVRLAREIAAYLDRQGFDTRKVHHGDDAVAAAATGVDVVLLDWMMPGVDGLTICRALRTFHRGPILMMTARTGDESEVRALEEGVDDYVTKPVRPRVLLARVRALLRRHGAPVEACEATVLRVDDLVVDTARREVVVGDDVVALTDTEYDLALLFVRNAGRVLSRDEISLVLFGRPHDGVDRRVDQYVSKLRRKMGDDAQAAERVKTVRGAGYLLRRASPP